MATKSVLGSNAQIEHPRFGCGTVLSCTEDYVVINFDDHGEKKFVSSIVLPMLKMIDRKPPAGKKTPRVRRPRVKKAAG